MQAVNIRQGTAPGEDGDVTRFVSPEVRDKAWFNPSKPVIFVNGMMNDPSHHVESAMALSLMMGAPVYGVYNAKIGFAADLWQCLTDKLRLSAIQAQRPSGFEAWAKLIEVEYQLVKKAQPGLSKTDYVGSLLGSNKATQSLYRLLTGQGGMLGAPIYCHSQGNLITSNALTAVALAKGTQAISGLEVNSFGSPCRYWPPGIRRTNYAFTFDPVSMLDLRADLTSSKVGYSFSHGFPVVHGFKWYAEQDGEFVVNRFRWGSWGMTFSLDEKGLAKFCANQGDNVRRLRAIFDRLEKAHPTDSDDVALEYVKLLSDTQIARLKLLDAGFVTQLVRLLESGATFADERGAIERLKAA
ncbi:hypothetical protein [Paracoccus zhejiangensis]|uniref:Uncharacterized protein n=1 Tax=Paracoccus zhejiangensis TaxID=1077935 RepID=A0A2H5EYV5_9RHOB|nr:hypothetical protein CX676_10135 [Paracoccus zhejiangensis]